MKRKIFVLQLFGFLQHENNPNTAFNRMLISFMNTQCSNVFKLENECACTEWPAKTLTSLIEKLKNRQNLAISRINFKRNE